MPSFGVGIFLLLLLVGSVYSDGVYSYQSKSVNNIGFEGSYFFNDTNTGNIPGYRSQYSLSLEPDLKVKSDDRKYLFRFSGLYRWDSRDDQRTHGDIRELYLSYDSGEYEILVGINKVFWGVTESRHLVDVINQTDFVENIDQEEKLGQPLVMLSTQRDWGELTLFFLPYFREANFPSEEGRLRLPIPIHPDIIFYESEKEQHHLDYAVRFSHYIADLDFGLYFFDGTNRKPLLFEYNDDDRDWLVPFYEQMRQYGIEIQYTRDAWLWKLESIYKQSKKEVLAYVLGVEYTFYQLWESRFDVGVLFEELGDDIAEQQYYSLEISDGYFLGARLVPNDESQTKLLIGATIHKQTHSTIFSLEFSRLINKNMEVTMEVRSFASGKSDEYPFASPLEKEDYAQFRIKWMF